MALWLHMVNWVKMKEKTPNEILSIFHNGSYYNYHFTIKQLVEEFEWQLACQGEKTEKYLTFFATAKISALSSDKTGKNEYLSHR